MEADKQEEPDVKQMDSTSATGGSQRAASGKELGDLRRLRGGKRAAVTRISKTAELLIQRHADRHRIREIDARLKEAFDELRNINQMYESKLDEGEIDEAREYADRLEEEECSIREKVQQYLQQLDETRTSTAASRRSRRSRERSRTSAISTGSTKSKEAEVELDDADSKLRDIKAQVEEERQHKMAKMQAEERRQQEEKRLQMEIEERRQQAEKRRQQEEWELEERERAMKIKVAEEARERAARKVRLYRAAEDDLNWDRRHDFEEPPAAEAERSKSADRGASGCTANPENVGDVPAQPRTQDVSHGRPTDPAPHVASSFTRPAGEYVRLGADDAGVSKNVWTAAVVSGTSLNPSTWATSGGGDRPEPLTQGSSAFTKSIPRLSLPRFNGNPSDWPRWIGLFKSLVHDQTSLSDAERMTHLQQAVEGAAHQAIEGFLFDGEMYQEALEALYQRFGREENVSQAYLDSMFSIPAPSIGDLTSFERFSSVISNAVMTLRALGYHGDLSASDHLRRVVAKLPSELTFLWGQEVYKRQPNKPDLEAFSEWLKIQVNILRYTAPQKRDSERRKSTAHPKENPIKRTTLITTTASAREGARRFPPCVICRKEHKLQECDEFKAKTREEKLTVVRSERLCWACLRKGHFMRECRSARQCDINGCKAKHHRLLHQERGASDNREGSRTERETQTQEGGPIVGVALKESMDTLLQLVPVKVHGPKGDKDVVALLDPGSQTSLCCEHVLEELGVEGEQRDLRIQTVEGSGKKQASRRVQLTVSPIGAATRGRSLTVTEVWSIPRLNVSAPSVNSRQMHSWKHLQGLNMPQYSGTQVELLLGANVIEAVVQREVRVGGPGQPVAVRTDFGWTLTGSITTLVPSTMRQVMFVSRQSSEEESLKELVQEWWTTESFGTKVNRPDSRSQEDLRALRILDQHTRKAGDRYETGLLWGEEAPSFPNNWKQAYHRLECTEKKLERQPDLAKKYQGTFDAYVVDGHAKKLSLKEAEEPNEKRWFLPHHAVVNPNKPGKVRVVFDAAASYGGTSLNDKLVTGPDLLQSLPGVLLRFREGSIAATADIKQMYHQVRIREEDQPASSFLWRDMERHRKPDVYQMQVVIFGAKSSPATANYVLRRALHDYGNEQKDSLSRSPELMARCFYMDDCLFSSMTEDEASQLHTEMMEGLKKGGFHLTKWRSNSPAVLQSVPDDEKANVPKTLRLKSSNGAEKALGIVWDELEDTLGFRLRPQRGSITKRGVLSEVSAVFDPLGIAAPLTVRAKVMMQHLWCRHIEWDEPLPEPELSLWLGWLSEVEKLSEVTLQRCVTPEGVETARRELHVFCDASESAFGAVAYWRTTTRSGSHRCRFLISKCRVAPLRRLSIVRLELQAAVLGARLVVSVIAELIQQPDGIYCWTDSKVIQQYLANETRRFKTFVANRLAEIHELTRDARWLHVPGKLNPADDCSRGLHVQKLTQDSRWLAGPDFLYQDHEHWPRQEAPAPLPSEEQEQGEEVLVGTTAKHSSDDPNPAKYSSWLKFRRIVSWVKRFVHNVKACLHRQLDKLTGPLSNSEVRAAEVWIVAQEQATSYKEESKCLEKQRELPTSSPLLPLTPVRDDNGLLRVGGRIGKASIPEEARHPIIIPRESELARLIIMHEHIQHGHAGVEHTLNQVRQSYWIPQGRSAVKKHLRECAFCHRRRTTPKPPRMADLPRQRLEPGRPFKNAGIDFFGPLLVKRLRKTEKRYGLLVTCMATRAVHLEVAHALDIDSCIMALRRFFARRSRPETIFSDRGTNFVGSSRELRRELLELSKLMPERLGAFEIDWRLNPPAASHMGGVWERMVRSVKTCLQAVVGSQLLTDEVLLTVFAEVEHMVNSRPLTYVSSNPADPEALTPNHFLLGRASPHLAPTLTRDGDLSSRRRWRQSQAVAGQVWRRWTREYIPTLTRRSKWRQESRSLQVGDLVLMVEPSLTRGSWPLAQIVRVFPGEDGRVRSAELKTSSGKLYTRPATKICFLEEDCN